MAVVSLPLSSELQPRDAILLGDALGYYDWGGNEMRNIKAPTLDLSAATKKYVDDLVGAVVVTAGIPLDPAIAVIRAKKVQLNGLALTPIVFGASTKASQTSANPAPFGLTHGYTLIATPDALGAATITISAVAGKHESGASPMTNISALVDNKFQIAVGPDALAPITYRTVTIDPAAGTTGANIATELQTKIQALGGYYAGVTVAYGSGIYTITGTKKGTGSKVLILASLVDDISTELKIGTLGTSTTGTGNVADVDAVTIAELVAIGMAGFALSSSGGYLKIESLTSGRLSKVTMGNGSGNTVLGFTNGVVAVGSQGMGYAKNMANANYFVAVTHNGTATLAAKEVSVNSRSVSGFDLLCETTSSTDSLDLIIFGLPAT